MTVAPPPPGVGRRQRLSAAEAPGWPPGVGHQSVHGERRALPGLAHRENAEALPLGVRDGNRRRGAELFLFTQGVAGRDGPGWQPGTPWSSSQACHAWTDQKTVAAVTASCSQSWACLHESDAKFLVSRRWFYLFSLRQEHVSFCLVPSFFWLPTLSAQTLSCAFYSSSSCIYVYLLPTVHVTLQS